MDLGIKNKVAVVLAGSAGIGRGIATSLAREGCNVALCARNIERLNATADFIRDEFNVQVYSSAADVSVRSELSLFLENTRHNLGPIDILVNNTGGPKVGKAIELSEQEYDEAYALVLMSKVHASRIVLPSMIERGWGRIINVESTSVKCALDNMALSNIFRSASAAFAKTLSMEVASAGVRVHTVMSGPFMTDRMIELGKIAAKNKGVSFDAWQTEAQSSTPLGRFGDPIEFGNLVAFLSSNQSSYMNGTCLALDGGILSTIT